jgi:bacillithiol system protein YtxJ
LKQVQQFLDSHPEIPVYMVDVVAQQPLSMEAARRLNVRHESPQAIAIVHGEAVWVGSHWEVTAGALAKAVAAE